MRLAKSCRECNSKKYEEIKKVLELQYQHLWIRKDGRKITDPWEIVDDQKDHTCDICRKEKSAKEFVIYGSKYNPKLTKACRVCNGYRRFQNERSKEGQYKEECYWNEHLIEGIDQAALKKLWKDEKYVLVRVSDNRFLII